MHALTCSVRLRLHLPIGLLPPGLVPIHDSPQLYISFTRASVHAAWLRPIGWGRRSVGIGGVASRAAATLFVLDERQDVGEREGLATLATGQEVTTFITPADLWLRRPLHQWGARCRV